MRHARGFDLRITISRRRTCDKVLAPQQTSFPRWSGPVTVVERKCGWAPADLTGYGVADRSADPFRSLHMMEARVSSVAYFCFDAAFSFRARDRVCLLNSIVDDNPTPS